MVDVKSPCSHDSAHYPVENGIWCTLSRLGIGHISFRNTINSEHYIDLVHEFLTHHAEEDISSSVVPIKQLNMSYSTGSCAKVIPVVQRLNHFKRTVASMLAGFVTTRPNNPHSMD
jgi:hypothetical protein